jgi:hypothetical protein
MSNASQRLKITEKGWHGYNGYFGGVEFKNGLSIHPVDPVTATRLGSIIRIVRADTDDQAGAAAQTQRTHDDKAPVVEALPVGEQTEHAPKTPEGPVVTHTRESLGEVADKHGIAGLRAIAEPMNVKGRGIAELIDEILKKQAVNE